MTRGNNWLTDDQLAEISSGVVGGVEPASPEKCCRFVTDMLKMHELVMNKTNAGASFYDAECIREMNLAPIQARQALTFARSKQ
ncbi:hypothetical protein GLY72_24245 [Salmonella enterica]|nr:hypothetical protein [Salmonella enterica]ECH8186169.1 hypothetical protein [Salmonella enterica subsp. enterica serovar Rissen]EDV8084106.1 hypothetical protein [Salmonella enterica subsp. enterica serovar Manhattan]EEJ6876566.1 hypothetical protein [Salmonella enterica subsp. houtenae]EBA6518227.1 hypothetical protein [Salmonella enterica]